MWLHKYVYKYKDNTIGIKLKDLYNNGIIKNEDDFKEELEKWKEYESFNMVNNVGKLIDKAMLS